MTCKCAEITAENKRLRDVLTDVRNSIIVDAPLSDTWWYTDTETMLDMVDEALKGGGE
jgi:hypothetical protein